MPSRLLALPVVAVVVLASCGKEAPPPAAPAAALSVSATQASIVTHGAVELLPGTLRAARAATVQARVPGVISRIHVVPGSLVAAGALLVELDAQELSARRDQARAQAAQAAADFARAQQLIDKLAVTRADFDAAQARAAGSAAAAAEAEIMVGYTSISAPFAGVVVRKHAEVGDLLAPGRPLIDLEDPASLRLEVEVPESLAAALDAGARLRVQVGGRDFEATVGEVTPASDPVLRSVLVKFALPADAAGLRSGQFGRVALPSGGAALLAVPAAAVVHRGQLDAVVVVQDGRARSRLVRLGAAEGGLVAVRAGLKPGEMVVTSDPAALRDGQAVSVR